jgi:hypothetical protein
MEALFPLLYSWNVPCLTFFEFRAINELQMLGAKNSCADTSGYSVHKIEQSCE